MSDSQDPNTVNFQKEQGDENGYVMACKHVISKSRPVLLIEMQIPYDEKHSGWDVSCNKEDCDWDLKEWPIQKLEEYEPSLKAFLKNPLGLPMIHRDVINLPWKVIK